MLLFLILLASLAMLPIAVFGQTNSPNIVLILTDDQDKLMDSMSYMGGLQSYLQAQGTTYTKHFCTVSLCCPSRATLLTGRAAHNTNITDVVEPFGGYTQFMARGYGNNWLGTWLQAAGYQTYYTGKLLNGINQTNYNTPFLPGLDGRDVLVSTPGTYQYYYPIYQRNEDEPTYYNNQYTTDLLIEKSLGFIDEAMLSTKPFFLTIAPVAPHGQEGEDPDAPDVAINPFPLSSPKYQNLFQDVQVPRTPNYNPDSPSGASWVKDLLQLSSDAEDWIDEWYRQRLRALQSVDELINKTVNALQSYGVLDNTYIIYTTDNGYHMGHHRILPGKRCAFEEDINIPMVIRGPGIPAAATASFVTSHIDLAPTILKMAGALSFAPNNLDGQPIPSSDADASGQNWEHVQAENWGMYPQSTYPTQYNNFQYRVLNNNTFKALRIVGNNYNLLYTVWCNNEHELYDMNTDPYQMKNLYGMTGQTILGTPLKTLQYRLDALLLVLKSCQGSTCTDPWSALHPAGGVTNLKDALLKKYNAFYKKQKKVKFEACKRGYKKDFEQPESFNIYKGKA